MCRISGLGFTFSSALQDDGCCTLVANRQQDASIFSGKQVAGPSGVPVAVAQSN